MRDFSDVTFVVQYDIDVFLVNKLSAFAADVSCLQVFGYGDGFIALRIFHEYFAYDFCLGVVNDIFFVFDDVSERRMTACGVAFEPAFS